MALKPGRFIVVEGPDGTGKSTACKHVVEYLRKQGREVVATYEVGGTDIGKEIRKLCFTTREEKLDARARLLMLLAARIQHNLQVIKPALEAGKDVVCDRYSPSTLAYQGVLDGQSDLYEELSKLFGWLDLDLKPDAIFFLYADPETQIKRMELRGAVDNNTYKAPTLERAHQITHAYQMVLRTCFSDVPVLTVDADHELEDVQAQLEKLVDWEIQEASRS